MRLYHTGFLEIPEPDIRHGRKNADFGQGFYLTPDEAFARRWAKERRGAEVYVNAYELDPAGLRVRRLERDEVWYDFIRKNRAGRGDAEGYDLVIGPIANDTLFNTAGLFASGLLAPKEALALLTLGPAYEQAAILSEKAAKQLTWLGAEKLPRETVAESRERLKAEEAAYLAQCAERLEKENG